MRPAILKLLLLVFFISMPAWGSDNLSQCSSEIDGMERLKCYDLLNASKTKAMQDKSVTLAERSFLTRSWDLDNMEEDLLGNEQSPLKPHRISYLIARQSNDKNTQPYSPSYGSYSLPIDIDLAEMKFQFSQKAKVLNPVKINQFGISSLRFWAAYSQQSNWQAFNTANSTPFRETSYEPELILMLNTGNAQGVKLVNFGYLHQSNGRNSLLSRSWNRFYLQGGWENDTIAVLLRGWWRVPEKAADDDNPDIVEYMGRGDLNLRWEPLDRSQVINLTLRNNFNAYENRGYMQLDWATPVFLSKSAKLHIQFTTGHGESLIDYNFFQRTFGIGASFRDW